MKNYDNYNKLPKEKEMNNNIELKDIKLDIEEAQYFVQKYIIITVYYLCVNYEKKGKCEECIVYKDIVSANQIRKFLAAVNQINNKLINKDNEVSTSGSKEKIADSIIDDIKYMKTQLAYLVGRNKDVNIRDGFKERNRCKNGELDDMLKSNMLKPYNDTEKEVNKKILNSIGNKIGIEALYIRILPKIDYIIEHKRLEDFKELARYIEAIVAYHRFYGGK